MNRSRATTSCRFEISSDFDYDFVHLSELWVASTSSDLQLKQVCHEGISPVIVKRGVSALNVSEGCKLVSDEFQLVGTQVVGVTKIEVEVSDYLARDVLNLSGYHDAWKALDLPPLHMIPLGELGMLSAQVNLVKAHESSSQWLLVLSFLCMFLVLFYLIYQFIRFRNIICGPRRLIRPSRSVVASFSPGPNNSESSVAFRTVPARVNATPQFPPPACMAPPPPIASACPSPVAHPLAIPAFKPRTATPFPLKSPTPRRRPATSDSLYMEMSP